MTIFRRSKAEPPPSPLAASFDEFRCMDCGLKTPIDELSPGGRCKPCALAYKLRMKETMGDNEQ